MPKLIGIDVARAYAEERWPSPVVRRCVDILLDNCPTVEVQGTAWHGRWTWFENRSVADDGDPECIGLTGYGCSVFGNNEGTCIRFYEELSPMVLADIKEGLRESLTNYCPNCGAKMGGGVNE